MGANDLSEATDAELVEEFLSGSTDAATILVRRFERPLLGVVGRMVGDLALAEDLVQESFVKAFRHLDRFDRSRKLSSWLFKIAHNTTLDHLRRHRLEVRRTVSLTPEDDEGPKREVAAPEEKSPFERAATSELAQGLERALAGVRPAHREILLLRFREHLQYQEIADVLGLRMNAVKVRLHRARKELGEKLAEMGFRPPEAFGGPGGDGG